MLVDAYPGVALAQVRASLAAALPGVEIEDVEQAARPIAEIDALIADCLASDWSLERMPRVDRCLARIAIWEMQSGTSSAEVAVQQAVQLAQELSTDGSANFLNGLLAKVKQRLEGNEN